MTTYCFGDLWKRASGLLLLLCAIGCSQSTRLPVHPVEGQLNFQGKPLANALVVLHPRDTSDPRLLPATAKTDAAGKFQLTTYEKGDGAASGEFTLTVQCYRLIKNGGGFEPGPNILPAKFAQAESSGIVVRVAEGKNDLQPITLH